MSEYSTFQLPDDDSENSFEFRRRFEHWGLYRYRPVEKPLNDQLGFHQDQSRVRVIIGSNRAGKTESPCAELSALFNGPPYPWWFNWKNPPPPPISAWVVVPFFNENPLADARIKKLYLGEESSDIHGNRIIKPPLIAPEMIDWATQDYRSVRGVNGSSVDFKASSQQSIQLASANVDYLYIDEPTRETHWNEALARMMALPTSRLVHCLTDTTLRARYLDRILAMKDRVPVFKFTTEGNPYRNKDASNEIIEMFDDIEREVRVRGMRYSETLLCYPDVFRWVGPDGLEIESPNGNGNWIAPHAIPEHWTRYVVHDPGRSNPAATVWFAVDPQGNIHAYKMRYWRRPPSSLKRLMADMIETNAGEKIDFWYIDPQAGKQPQVHTNDYYIRGRRLIDFYREVGEPYGVEWRLGSAQIQTMPKMDRLAYAHAYMDPTDNMHPMIWFHDKPEMKPLREEFMRYRMSVSKDPTRNAPETTHDADNHAIYCVEFICQMPGRYEQRESSGVYTPTEQIEAFMIGDKPEGFGSVITRA